MAQPPDFSVPEGYYPPFAIITESDHSGWIIIATALGLSLVVICSGIRVYLRTRYRYSSGVDDILLVAATVLALAQEIVVLYACHRGLGRSIELLSPSSLSAVEKLSYSAQILAIFPFGLSKCSLAVFILRLTPSELVRKVLYGILILVVAWMAASVLAFGLQCHLAYPWAFIGQQCTGVEKRILVIGLFDIFFEIALFAVSISLVLSLRTGFHKKAVVLLAFGMRLPIIALVIARILSFRESKLTTNFTLAEDYYIVWTETEINYCLISTTLPVLRPFIKDLSTYYGGRWYSESTSASRANSHPLAVLNTRSSRKSKGRQNSSPIRQASGSVANAADLGLLRNDTCENSVLVVAETPRTTIINEVHGLQDQAYQAKLSLESQRGMIRVNTEWAVERHDFSTPSV